MTNKTISPSRPRRTLRSTVIEPFKQMKLGVYVMAITLCFVTIAAYLFVAAYTKQYQEVMNIFEIVDPVMQWELVNDKTFKDNGIKLAVVFVSFIGILFWVILNMTHKYYGPLVSIERFVDEISRGHYDRRVKIRRGDELGRLVEKLNLMAEKLEEKHGRPSAAPSDEEHSGVNLRDRAG